jgi:riboflavin kinase/FMN adenylyltransferase
MQVHFGLDLLTAEWQQSIACIGTFDGVHLGHQRVISEAIRRAREAEMPSVLVTFDRHPAAVLAPDRKPHAIASLYQNLAQFERLGASVVVVLAFDRNLSQTSASAFFEHVVENKLRVAEMVVGHDFAFGQGRQGTPEWLAERLPTHVVPPFELDGHRVSSSAIRSAVLEGRVEDAASWLGRPFEVTGVVVIGQRFGRTLGFPTLNIARSFDQAAPADGVYACVCHTPRGTYLSAANVGMRPAVNGKERTIEAYLIDYSGEELYGSAVSLAIVKRLRPEAKFESLEGLKAQMARDVEETRRLLKDEYKNKSSYRLGDRLGRSGSY